MPRPLITVTVRQSLDTGVQPVVVMVNGTFQRRPRLTSNECILAT